MSSNWRNAHQAESITVDPAGGITATNLQAALEEVAAATPVGLGITASVAELNKLDGAGDVVASGTPVVFIADPTGSATDQDDEARAAIADLRDALVAFGIVLPEEE